MSDRTPLIHQKSAQVEKQFFDEMAMRSSRRAEQIDLDQPLEHMPALIFERMGSLEGKRVLDIGAGRGEYSVHFARRGASVVAVDLSPEMCAVARSLAERYCVAGQVEIRQGTLETAGLLPESFDVIFGNAILHHLELDRDVPCLVSLLKKGGFFVFVEPLRHNPLANLYRYLTPHWHTPGEKPLSLQDIDNMRRRFSRLSYSNFYLISHIRVLVRQLFRSERLSRAVFEALLPLDEFILRLFPGVRKYCCYTLICGEK